MLMLLFSLSGAIIGTAKMAGLLQEDGGVRGSTAVYMSLGAQKWLGNHGEFRLLHIRNIRAGKTQKPMAPKPKLLSLHS